MALASLIVAIMAILIAIASAGYTRRQAIANAGLYEIERARHLEERRPRLSGRIERIGHSPDAYQLRITLNSNEPLTALDIEMPWTGGFAFQRGGFGVYPAMPGEVSLRAFAYDRSDNEPTGVQPRGSVTWRMDLVGSSLDPVHFEATCHGEDEAHWDRVLIKAEVEADPQVNNP
jgi:hypothetical protein